jgi:hypothetical protein
MSEYSENIVAYSKVLIVSIGYGRESYTKIFLEYETKI